MTDPTPKPEPIPSDAQTVQWEASTAMALRVLRVLAEVTTSGELASSGYLRKRCGLSAEEWHGSGELMASLICFASDKGFLEWHARDMVDATSDPKPEPSELAKLRLPNCTEPRRQNCGLVADLEARLEAAEQRWKDATEWCSGEFPCEASTHAAEFERAREAAREVLRISDRKHDAWDRLRAALDADQPNANE